MTRGRLVALALVAGACAGGYLLLHRGGHPPFFPRYRRQVDDKLFAAAAHGTHDVANGSDLLVAQQRRPMPKVLPSVAAYRSALATGDDHPGAAAFRADTDMYCEYNMEEVEAQARKEGLTVAEVKELTFFGFVGMRTTQPEKVAEAIGRPLTDEETRHLGEILDSENKAFAKKMHEEVDRGASEDDRWALIREAEQHYRQQFADAYGITEAQFDQMLAPDEDTSGGGPRQPLTNVSTPGAPPPPPPPPSGGEPGPAKPPPSGPGLIPAPGGA